MRPLCAMPISMPSTPNDDATRTVLIRPKGEGGEGVEELWKMCCESARRRTGEEEGKR